jgi:hypothetical protein
VSGDLILALLVIGGIAFLVAFTCFLLIADRRSEVPYIDLGDD